MNTDRPRRFLAQFCKHADAVGSGKGHRLRAHGDDASALSHVTVRAEWSETEGTVTLDPLGRCRLQASETTLVVRVEARDGDSLRRIEEIVGNNLGRFSRGQLALAW